MEFPAISQLKEQLIDNFSAQQQIAPTGIAVIASPYRICPLGAHIDHQGGPVLGMTINACTLMAFHAQPDDRIRLTSRNYPGRVSFNLSEIGDSTGSFWGVYPRAAALALQERYDLKHGICGLLDGMLPGCGLSSSASVLLAYLQALAHANELELSPWDYVNLTRRAENRYIGLNNGILDQTSIVFGRKGHLLHIDTVEKTVSELEDRRAERDYRIIVAYSGYSRELTTSGYNSRVDECRTAAAELSALGGNGESEVLGQVDRLTFERHGAALQKHIRRRAAHFFSESERVARGVEAWSSGNIDLFGQLMNESCRSSIEQYECGVPAVCDLQQIVSGADGVLGSRFMGGGFGGCVVGLVRSSSAENTAREIAAAYRQQHPEVADQAVVYLGRSDDGVRFV
jgi:galactokinase